MKMSLNVVLGIGQGVVGYFVDKIYEALGKPLLPPPSTVVFLVNKTRDCLF